ncbi:exodeoxyribonuclease I [Methylocaldum marinum]|uniref:Exodeoxyribonuclease I n=1 Tax=Methylocaldum marinum TaxID=1432792 RepID=A0A250KRR4_9GAMM|nr:exodeoxyribonuclease I [Methylocaldum marinum]BBA34373.1 exodeoxyribonuclease I [Methylocaldum marinum]
MSSCSSLYWYDYETFGTDPKRDRPAQFGGIRTDLEFNPIGEPLTLFCKPARDTLPVPEACLITGITPQMAAERGVTEAEFIATIHDQFSVPGTCVAGYNNIRFDDEVTRNCLYRNLFDPYEREWRNGNSRWDIIDMLRLTRALRPEGIEWPRDEHGRPTLRLDTLTVANGIRHENAHDALADVRATIAVARLIRDRQPKLFNFVFNHRGKREVFELLKFGAMQPVLHVSEKYAADRCCIAVVVALAKHPRNPNGIIVYDLSVDPEPLITLSAEEVRERLYTPVSKRPPGIERIPLKTVHINKCPVVAPLSALRPEDAERLQIDLAYCDRNLDLLKEALNKPSPFGRGLGEGPLDQPVAQVASPNWRLHQSFLKRELALPKKIREVMELNEPNTRTDDPDLMLYDGGFIGDADRTILKQLRALSPEELSRVQPAFEDARLPELVFRYRARNFPETLTAEESARWETYRIRRLTAQGGGGSLVMNEYQARIDALEASPDLSARDREILASLRRYAREIIS